MYKDGVSSVYVEREDSSRDSADSADSRIRRSQGIIIVYRWLTIVSSVRPGIHELFNQSCPFHRYDLVHFAKVAHENTSPGLERKGPYDPGWSAVSYQVQVDPSPAWVPRRGEPRAELRSFRGHAITSRGLVVSREENGTRLPKKVSRV